MRWQGLTMRRTGCSSTAVASRSTAVQVEEKGGAWRMVIGRTKGGRNTKLHAVCDTKGRPYVLLLMPGNVHDCQVARLCIEALPPATELVADKAYDSQALREWLNERGTQSAALRRTPGTRGRAASMVPGTDEIACRRMQRVLRRSM
ncbi:Transposase [Agrobacterium sp. DSM 25558]|nr:Transposase [Agrobacterium sp. DSM 25558]